MHQHKSRTDLLWTTNGPSTTTFSIYHIIIECGLSIANQYAKPDGIYFLELQTSEIHSSTFEANQIALKHTRFKERVRILLQTQRT